MERYLVFKNLIQNLSFKFIIFITPLNVFALAGIHKENPQKTSSQLVVRYVLNMQQPPFIHLTLARPTVVQFPSEVRECITQNKSISVDYANGDGSSHAESANNKSVDENKSKKSSSRNSPNYSAVTLNIASTGSLSAENLFNTPETYMICSIKMSPSDTFCESYKHNQDPYCFVTVGIQMKDPSLYNAIVYLDKPGSDSSLPPLPEKKHLEVNRIQSDSLEELEFVPKIKNIEPIISEPNVKMKSILTQKLNYKNSNDKFAPLPKDQFEEDRILGLQADNNIKNQIK